MIIIKNYKYLLIVLTGLILWIGNTAYFGYNTDPASGVEAILDAMSFILVGWGIFGDILQGLVFVKNNVTNIDTGVVNVVFDEKDKKEVKKALDKRGGDTHATKK